MFIFIDLALRDKWRTFIYYIYTFICNSISVSYLRILKDLLQFFGNVF